MQKSTLLLFSLLFIGFSLHAQRQETLFGDHRMGFTGIWGAFTSTYNFYEDEQGFQPGGNIGFEFGRTVFLGYAWSKLRDDIELPGAGASFRLRQNSFLLSIAPSAYQVLHPVISIQTGGGRLELSDGSRDRVFIFQPSAGLELNVFRWFHLGLDGGYRFVGDLDLKGVEREEVSNFFAQLNLRFGVSWGNY